MSSDFAVRQHGCLSSSVLGWILGGPPTLWPCCQCSGGFSPLDYVIDANSSQSSSGYLVTGQSNMRRSRLRRSLYHCKSSFLRWLSSAHGPSHSFLVVYSALLLAATFLELAARYLYMSGSLRACKVIHKKLMGAILGTTLRYAQPSSPVSPCDSC